MSRHSGIYCTDGKLCTEPSCTEQLQRCRHDEKFRAIRFLNSQEAATQIEELQRQLAERDKDLEAMNSVLRRDKGWGQGEIDSITDLWEQNESLNRQLAALEAVIEQIQDVKKKWDVLSGEGEACMYEIDAILATHTSPPALVENQKNVISRDETQDLSDF